MIAANNAPNSDELVKEVMRTTNCSQSIASTALLDTKYVVEKAILNIRAGLVNDDWQESGKKKKSSEPKKIAKPSAPQRTTKSKVTHYTSQARPKTNRETNGRRPKEDSFENICGMVFTPAEIGGADFKAWNNGEPQQTKKPSRYEEMLFDMSDFSDFELEIETSVKPANFTSGKLKLVSTANDKQPECDQAKEESPEIADDLTPPTSGTGRVDMELAMKFKHDVTFGRKCRVRIIGNEGDVL